MQNFIIISAVLAAVIAAPGNIAYNTYVPLAKSTLTSSSQTVDHGSTHIVHTPLLHMTHEVEYHVPLSKTTSTKSSQIVNHGGTSVVHAPVTSLLHAPVHAPYLVHSSPVVTYNTGDSAISHHSSTIHETVPVINHLPYYALH